MPHNLVIPAQAGIYSAAAALQEMSMIQRGSADISPVDTVLAVNYLIRIFDGINGINGINRTERSAVSRD